MFVFRIHLLLSVIEISVNISSFLIPQNLFKRFVIRIDLLHSVIVLFVFL